MAKKIVKQVVEIVASDRDGVLVVDSRLIAEDLGVQHKNLLATLDKHLARIEEEWGRVAFETLTLETNGGKQSTRIAWLTEPQSNLLMSFSRNTAKVIDCKCKLIKAFELAKKAIASQSSEIEKMRLENENLKLQIKLSENQVKLSDNQQKLLATVHLLESVSPGLAPLALGKTDAVVERVEYVERTITPDATYEGVGITYIQKRFGFKTLKQTWAWLESIGFGKYSGKWDLQLSAVETHKMSPEILHEISQKFAQREGCRQLLIGEM